MHTEITGWKTDKDRKWKGKQVTGGSKIQNKTDNDQNNDQNRNTAVSSLLQQINNKCRWLTAAFKCNNMLELLNQARSPEDIHINVRHSKTDLCTRAERETEG